MSSGKTTDPSLYPKPSTPPPPVGSAELLPPVYEVLVELQATLTETSPNPILKESLQGTMRIVQGPLDLSQSSSSAPAAPYHAFLSLEDVNIPLLPSHPIVLLSADPPLFELSIPQRTFTIRPDTKTSSELIETLQQAFQWFCAFQAAPNKKPSTPAGAMPSSAPEQQPPSSSQERIARAGDKGVQLVENIGGKVNSKIQGKLSEKVESANAANAERDEPRNVRMGGKVTASVLSGTRTVVGAGANVASVVIDKVSSAVGTGLAKNPISKNMAKAPEGSKKRSIHDNLVAGMLAFGRVYVAADDQGRTILENTGRGGAELARVKYGSEAENAARKLGGIAVDGYRIARFPAKMGATGLVKGALKAGTKMEAGRSSSGQPEMSDRDFGMSSGNVAKGFPDSERAGGAAKRSG